MAEDQYDLDHAIEKMVRESEYCRLCRCKGDCPGGCVWSETTLCSNCIGTECASCGNYRATEGKTICKPCMRRAHELAQERADFGIEQAETDRLVRWLQGKEPGRAPKKNPLTN